jgi:S-adenosylmethionine decarboxylase
MYDCPAELLNDARFVELALTQATAESGCTLIKHLVHKFEPQGVTGLALLAESHISIHTWPEANYAAADVFTCGHKADPGKACAYLVRIFQAGQHSLMKLERGELVASQKPELFAEYPQPNLEPQVETAVS